MEYLELLKENFDIIFGTLVVTLITILVLIMLVALFIKIEHPDTNIGKFNVNIFGIIVIIALFLIGIALFSIGITVILKSTSPENFKNIRNVVSAITLSLASAIFLIKITIFRKQ